MYLDLFPSLFRDPPPFPPFACLFMVAIARCQESQTRTGVIFQQILLLMIYPLYIYSVFPLFIFSHFSCHRSSFYGLLQKTQQFAYVAGAGLPRRFGRQAIIVDTGVFSEILDLNFPGFQSVSKS
jgi:hypothetical protein